jgi:transposase-like protein
MKTRKTREIWQEIIKQYQASNQSQTTFSKEQNINVHTLKYWLKKFNQENKEDTTWAELKIKPESKAPSMITIEHDDIKIHIPHSNDMAFIKDLVTLLKSL